MKTLLLLVEDDYAETLIEGLPADKAWVLDARYDTFRCQVRQTLEVYRENPSGFTTYSEAVARMDNWLEEQQS